MRATINISAEFTAPPNLVRKVITEALASSRHVLREPEPFVFISGPNQLGIEYIVGFSFPSYMDWFEAQDEAMSAIWSAFRRNGIRPGVNHHYVDAGGPSTPRVGRPAGPKPWWRKCPWSSAKWRCSRA